MTSEGQGHEQPGLSESAELVRSGLQKWRWRRRLVAWEDPEALVGLV
jgi:hypothetical protein